MAVYLGNKLVDTIYMISYYKDVPKYFARTSFTVINAEDLQGLRKIRSRGFYKQSKLYKITLPETVQEIGKRAFDYCDKLERIIFLSTTPPSIETDSLTTGTSITKIYVPKGCLDVYKNAKNWSKYANQLKES